MGSDGLIHSIMAVIIGGFVTLILVRCLGEVVDRIIVAFTKAGIFDVTTWSSPTDSMIDIMYLACYMPLLASLIYAFFNARRQTPQDVSGVANVDYYQPGWE